MDLVPVACGEDYMFIRDYFNFSGNIHFYCSCATDGADAWSEVT